MTIMTLTPPPSVLTVLEAPPALRPLAATASRALDDATPIRVLLVDDDRMLRSALADLLEDLGFSVVGQAEDGERGVALAAEHLPDVVLMDLRMPGIDGIEATRLIRGTDALAQVVIFSAYDDAGFQKGAEAAGVCCYLVKGCGPGILTDVIRSAGSLRRQLDARARDMDPSAPERHP